jgi:signal transduction histidine kinase
MLLLTWRISFDQAVDQPAQAAVDVAGNTVGVSIDMASFVGALLDLASVFFGTLLAAWLVVRVTKRPLQHLNPAARWLVVVISAIAVAALAQLFITVSFSLFNRQISVDQNVLIRLAVIIPIAAVSVILGLVRAIETAQRDVKEQLDETNSALQWQVTRINEEIWDQRRTMALVVHGPMRAALISSAMQLAKTSKTPSPEGEILEMLRSRINDARSGDLLEGQATDLLSSVRKLQELWRGTCEITVTIDQATQRQLEADSVASHAAEKIIDEACSNAITHGNATAIDITLTATNDRLDITVTNNGAPPKANDQTGLGQAFLEEVTLNWSLTSGASGTKLVAALPLIG